MQVLPAGVRIVQPDGCWTLDHRQAPRVFAGAEQRRRPPATGPCALHSPAPRLHWGDRQCSKEPELPCSAREVTNDSRPICRHFQHGSVAQRGTGLVDALDGLGVRLVHVETEPRLDLSIDGQLRVGPLVRQLLPHGGKVRVHQTTIRQTVKHTSQEVVHASLPIADWDNHGRAAQKTQGLRRRSRSWLGSHGHPHAIGLEDDHRPQPTIAQLAQVVGCMPVQFLVPRSNRAVLPRRRPRFPSQSPPVPSQPLSQLVGREVGTASHLGRASVHGLRQRRSGSDDFDLAQRGAILRRLLGARRCTVRQPPSVDVQCHVRLRHCSKTYRVKGDPALIG